MSSLKVDFPQNQLWTCLLNIWYFYEKKNLYIYKQKQKTKKTKQNKKKKERKRNTHCPTSISAKLNMQKFAILMRLKLIAD